MKIYFLSTGRAGTSLLYRVFDELYPDINISHQTNWSRFLNVAGNLPFRDKSIFSLYALLKKTEIPNSTVDPLLSVPISRVIQFTKINTTEYKIIHLVRDPRTFVSSFMNWKNSSFKKKILHYVIPFWQPTQRLNSGLTIKERIAFDKFKQFCYVWTYKNDMFHRLFSNGNNYFLLRLEDLTDPVTSKKVFTELIAFLDLPLRNEMDFPDLLSKKMNVSKKKSFPGYQNWTFDQKEYLKKVCGPLMCQFGYKL